MSTGSFDPSAPQPDRIRLHITPFNADLYDRIIPPSLQPLATGASFHTVQTFPDKGYGFVELPVMDAQKLKKKLNGSTLKGTKMSVEEARPAKKRKSDAEAEPDEAERKKAKREKGQRKKEQEDGVLAGHELEEGRRVKRGWTGDDSRDGKKKGRTEGKGKTSKESDDRKLRFKTKVPPNKAALQGEREGKKKDKKSKKGEDKSQVVVEEFTKRRKSRKGDNLIDGAAPGSTSYEAGKGWVDEAGNVVEPERKSKRRKRQPTASPAPSPSSNTDLGDATGGAEEDQPNGVDATVPADDEDAENSASADPISDSENEATSEQAKEVHPLEALFKRPADPTTEQSSSNTPTRPRPAPIDTSFSFFGAGDTGAGDEDTEMAETGVPNGIPPVTPHTKQDLEWRSLRSAAPTPDTAAIGRKFSFPFAGHDDVEDEEDEEEDDYEGEFEDEAARNTVVNGEANGTGDGNEESTFRKWFFENRGDLNRGWKKRRREERKVRRQRENRRLGRKVA